MKWLGDVSSGRANNFNLIRMIAASAVLLSHSWPIALGAGTIEPAYRTIGHSLGHLAVLTFFAISGFFICKSFATRRTFLSFLAARVMRIYPGLIVVLLLTLLLLGPLFTVLPLTDYFAGIGTFTYLPRNLSLRFLQYDLPGVFADNPYGPAINGSLWTLIHEVLCYAMVVAVGLAGLLGARRFPLFLAAFALAQLLIATGPEPGVFVRHLGELSVPFVMGMSLYIYRSHVPLTGWIVAALLAACWGLQATPAYDTLLMALITYGAFWLGHVDWWGKVPYNRLGDYSYGMYIYAFPVQQATIALMPGLGPWALAAISFAVTLVLAVLSWMLVEHPALERREQVADGVRRIMTRRQAARG